MKKRKRQEEEVEHEASITRKKIRKESDDLGKYMSFVETGDSLAGLTYFLTAVQREGSSLISAYLQLSPSCDHILAPLQWDRDKQTHDNLLLCFECLESVLLHTASLDSSVQSESSTGTGPSLGLKLVSAILHDHMRPIYSSLMTSCPMKLVAACLRLLTAMVLQGHQAARDVQQIFNFGYKPLIVFPNRTHRVKGSSDSVRTYFIKFALSFLIAGDNEVIRNVLELKRFLSSVFKLLLEDSVEIVHLFVSTLREKVLRNSGVSKRAKSALFNIYALKQLSGLLSPLESEGAEGDGKGRRGKEVFQLVSQEGGEVVSLTLHQYILEVLTELCTSFQYGVCYKTKVDVLLAERSNNPAILQLLLSLTGMIYDSDVQGLIINSIATCPDILTPYLQSTSLSFEPRPHSKWVHNVEFLTNLFSGLPPVPETLGISGQPALVSFLPAAVSLTVPCAVTRTMFNQGVQNATPLLRLKTLALLDVILKRASETVSALKTNELGPTSFCVMYTDAVLKLLPELKTLINLRQQLVVPARPTVDLAKKVSDNLTSEQRILNAALLEGPALISQCLVVMRGYQCLSPSLFAQADFNPAKLLPSLSDLQVAKQKPASCGHTTHPAVMMATLALLEEAPGDYFKWRLRKSGTLSSLLWLVVCGEREISRAALNLSLKLLLSVDSLSTYTVEMGVVLTAARRFFRVCLAESTRAEEENTSEGDEESNTGAGNVGTAGEDDEGVHFVVSLAEMCLAIATEPHRFTSWRTGGEGTSVSSSDQSLQSILTGPLTLPPVSEVVSLSEEQEACPVSPSSRHCLLLPALLSHIDCDKYFPFVCDVVLKLLLAQDNFKEMETNARLLLLQKDKWMSRSWFLLSHSLARLLQCWARDTSISMEVDSADEKSFNLSSRKVLKKLKKMRVPAGRRALELFCNIGHEQLMECVATIATRSDLFQALLYYYDLRPLHLLGCYDYPAIKGLLSSLPFTTLVLQSFQMEPSISASSSHLPLLPASHTLTELPLQLWQESLAVNHLTSLDILCSARLVLALLLELYRRENVETMSAIDVGFCLLEEMIGLVLAPNVKLKSSEKSVRDLPPLPFASPDVLMTIVFSSSLVQSVFSLPSYTDTESSGGTARKQQRRRARSGSGRGVRTESGVSVEAVYLDGVGKLLSTGLRYCEDFKKSDCFLDLFQRLLTRIQNCGECNTDIISSLLGVLEATRPHLGPSSVRSAIKCILHTLITSPSSPLLSQVLLTLLTPHSSFQGVPANIDTNQPQEPAPPTHSYSSSGGAPTNYPTNELCSSVSDCALQQLLTSSIKEDSEPLNLLAFHLVCNRLGVSPNTMNIGKWNALEWSPYKDLHYSAVDGCRCRYMPLCSFHVEPVEEEICQQMAVVVKGLKAKGLSSPFLLGVQDRFSNSPVSMSTSWLPNDLLHQLLSSYCSKTGVTQCSLIGCILLHLKDRTLDYFSTTCIPKLCSQVETSVSLGEEEPSHVLESALFLLAVSLTTITRVQGTEQDCKKWKETMKLVRKSVWRICSTAITTDLNRYSANVKGLCVRVLCLLCQVSSQARKKLRKVAESWDTEGSSWTRYQMWVVGMAGCVGRDTPLCAMAARRLLHQVVYTEGEGEWRDQYLRLLPSVLGELLDIEESVNIDAQDWNGLVEKSLNENVRLLSVVTVLCAGAKLWTHSEFNTIMFSTSDSVSSVKDSLVELLVYVSEQCATVCDTSHVPTLLGAYSASRTRADRGLLYLLFLYEVNGANVGKFKPFLWGEAVRREETRRREVGWLQWEAPGTRQVLDSLDTHRITQSLDHFPQNAPLEPVNPFTAGVASESGEKESVVYDPAFMLPLLSHILDPGGMVDCRVVVESGALSYLLAALSSRVDEVRMAATHCLSRFSAHLRVSTCREKPQLSLLLRIVKNTLEEKPQVLPSLHTAFCAKLARIFLDPGLLLYPVLGHYIVHKPVLELRDIPLFYTLLHSSSTQHCMERGWLLSLLVSGLRSEEDYRLYQRKRVLPHLMALYTAPCMDSKARTLILKLVLRACSFSVAASDLVWNHGLLPWLAQIMTCGSDCDVVWKILCMVCKKGMKEGEESSCTHSAKPPPLLEEELALTVSSLIRLSDGSRRAAPLFC